MQAANKQFICQNGIEGDKIRLSVKFNLLILYEKDEHKMYYYYLTKEKENTRTHTLRKFRTKGHCPDWNLAYCLFNISLKSYPLILLLLLEEN